MEAVQLPLRQKEGDRVQMDTNNDKESSILADINK